MSAILDPSIAIDLINGVVYRPGWKITATTHTNFEQAIKVRFDYPAVNSSRQFAPLYETPVGDGTANASFIILVDGCDEAGLMRQILDKIRIIEEHESREFLRFGPHLDAPFHPHTIGGMRAWGDVQGDLTFGMA